MGYLLFPINEDDIKGFYKDKEEIVRLGTGESHAAELAKTRAVQAEVQTIDDPRPEHDGILFADRYFEDKTKGAREFVGVRYKDSEEKFCCSYACKNWEDFKSQYNKDMAEKKEQKQGPQEQIRLGFKR